jgi:hypothetical protein
MTVKHLKPHQFQPKERAAALDAGLKTYFNGKPCKKGHIAYRCAANGVCVECGKIKQKLTLLKRLEKEPDYYKNVYNRNSEKLKAAAAAYRMKNPEKIRLLNLKSAQTRKPQRAAAEMKRSALKLSATPKWLSDSELSWIQDYYNAARHHKEDLGIVLAVDHIVPLRGKEVCGLHVPWNLCLRTKSDNSKKHNKLTEDAYLPKQTGILVMNSALPWNLKKEFSNDNI